MTIDRMLPMDVVESRVVPPSEIGMLDERHVDKLFAEASKVTGEPDKQVLLVTTALKMGRSVDYLVALKRAQGHEMNEWLNEDSDGG